MCVCVCVGVLMKECFEVFTATGVWVNFLRAIVSKDVASPYCGPHAHLSFFIGEGGWSSCYIAIYNFVWF